MGKILIFINQVPFESAGLFFFIIIQKKNKKNLTIKER